MNNVIRTALLCGVLVAAPALADVIVIDGYLSGTGEPHYQDFEVPQFDDQGGTRTLNFVQLDFLTSIRAGYQLDDSGGFVNIYACLDADYYLGDELLAETQALIRDRVHNVGFGAYQLFDTDTEQVVIAESADMAPWIGDGQVTLTAFTEFVITEDPPGIILFDGGGTVRYSVTYDYSTAGPDCPGDFDGDLDIDLQDLAVLLANYGITGGATYEQGDIDGDGDVDLGDLSALLAVYGTAC